MSLGESCTLLETPLLYCYRCKPELKNHCKKALHNYTEKEEVTLRFFIVSPAFGWHRRDCSQSGRTVLCVILIKVSIDSNLLIGLSLRSIFGFNDTCI